MYEGAEDRKITGETSCLSVYWQFVEVGEFCMFFSVIFRTRIFKMVKFDLIWNNFLI